MTSMSLFLLYFKFFDDSAKRNEVEYLQTMERLKKFEDEREAEKKAGKKDNKKD
jgi:hypothetical protein